MTIAEKTSLRKKKAIIYLIDNGEYSLGYALMKVEELHDLSKLTEEDYDYLAEYIENLLDNKEDVVEEPIEENTEEEL